MFKGLTRTWLAALILIAALVGVVAPAAAQTDPGIQVELVGSIQALTLNTVTVNGLLIDTTGAQINTALTLDLIVKVEAVQRADGTLQATQIGMPDASDLLPGEVELVGRLQTMTATHAELFGLVIGLNGAEVQAGVTLGETVRVRARLVNGSWVAREIAPFVPAASASPDGTPVAATVGDELEFTGSLESMGDTFLVVSGQMIDVNGAEIKAGLVIGALVKIHFSLVNGQMVVREVEPALNTNRNQEHNGDDNSNANGNLNANLNTNLTPT